MSVRVLHGDSREILPTLEADSIDAVVTDPPYALESIRKRFGKPGSAPAVDRDGLYKRTAGGFMGQQWDTGDTAFDPAFWAEVLRVMKPGAHLVAFGGTRTYHRLACAIEDSGFEIRDQVQWLFGSGFPKNHDIGKAIDKAADYKLQAAIRRAAVAVVDSAGLELPDNNRWDWTTGEHAPGNRWWARFQEWLPELNDDDRERVEGEIVSRVQKKAGWFTQSDIYDARAPATEAAKLWDGWGTALKPASEPICFARKPFNGTIAGNVLEHGTGAINIEGCRVGTEPRINAPCALKDANVALGGGWRVDARPTESNGRWPANVIHDGSEEVLEAFGRYSAPGAQRPVTGGELAHRTVHAYGKFGRSDEGMEPRGDTGTAARFFYSSKADSADRLGSKHPTVKPVDLMAYLCRLITPPGGTVLDPFAGSGTTGMACMREGFDSILIEREAKFIADIQHRLRHVKGEDAPLFSGIAP